MNMLIIFSLIILTLWTQIAFAELEFKDHAYPEFVLSSQNLGMANSSIGDDIGAFTFFNNPAAKLPEKKHTFSVININGRFNSTTRSLTFDKHKFSGKILSTGRDFLSFTNMWEQLEEVGGGVLNQELSLVSYYQYRRFSMGYFTNFKSTGSLKDENSAFNASKRTDSGPFISTSAQLGRRFLVGLTYIYLTREEDSKTRPANATDAQNDAFGENTTREGSASHFIFGMKYRIGKNPFQQISLVNRNTTNSNFFFNKQDGKPAKIPNTTDLSYSMWLGSKTKWKFNATLRDALGAYDVVRSRKVQLGMHIDFNRAFALRFGLAESSPTFGIGMMLWKRLGIDVSTYSVDLSESENVSKDRRYAVELTLK